MTVIVRIKEGSLEDVVKSLNEMSGFGYSIKDNNIVLFFDTDNIHSIIRILKKIQDMENVIGVYPIFSGNPEKLI
ncbi:MAG: chaperone NapD [Thermodesulfovibrionales bacterium]